MSAERTPVHKIVYSTSDHLLNGHGATPLTNCGMEGFDTNSAKHVAQHGGDLSNPAGKRGERPHFHGPQGTKPLSRIRK